MDAKFQDITPIKSTRIQWQNRNDNECVIAQSAEWSKEFIIPLPFSMKLLLSPEYI